MASPSEIERLRQKLADLERKSQRSGWLMRQLGNKLKHFPRDFSRRMRRSMRKKMLNREKAGGRVFRGLLPGAAPGREIHWVCDEQREEFGKRLKQGGAAADALNEMREFLFSDQFGALVDAAAQIDPAVGSPRRHELTHLPPWYDRDYAILRRAMGRLPSSGYENVVLVPFGKLGGADFVAGILARVLESKGKTLILRTDRPDWERPDWYPPGVDSVDISDCAGDVLHATHMLYVMIQMIAPRRLFNVNSRLAFDMFVDYGERLARQYQLYAYYFCADRDQDGREVGYPVEYFAPIYPHLRAAMLDTAYLRRVLQERYALPDRFAARLQTIYTPAMSELGSRPVVERQIGSRAGRTRPRLLWAGRLDRQKRFDLVIETARALPEVEFLAWGKAVLDKARTYRNLPGNLTLNPPFESYDDLPLEDSDGWLYTSAWDGLPTILIEIAAKGMPVVASAVGGVPELIDGETGWLVEDWQNPAAYVGAIREMLADEAGRRARATALQERVRLRHGIAAYDEMIRKFWQ